MMAELEKTVKGLQAGTAADSQQVAQGSPQKEVHFDYMGIDSFISWVEFLLSYFLSVAKT